MQTNNKHAKNCQYIYKYSVNKVFKPRGPSPKTNTVTDLVAGVFATILILITLLHMDPANAMAVIM